MWRRSLLVFTLLLAIALLGACASGPKLVWQKFAFDGWSDGWAKQVDLLEYSYGDQYKMVRDRLRSGQERLGYTTNVNGPMPVGEFLYVKWRIKETGEIIEDRVDLRDKLARNMFEHGVTFVIDGKQLYVYLRTPTPRSPKTPSGLKTYLADTRETFEIYQPQRPGR